MADVAYIPLYRGSRWSPSVLVGYAVVDKEDEARLSQYRWHLHTSGYAARTGQPKVYMHREVLGLVSPAAMQVDHINRDKLDNRRCNLRLASPGQQRQNASVRSDSLTGYRGVKFHKQSGLYHAHARIAGRIYSLRYHKTAEEAAAAASAFRAQYMPFSSDARATPSPAAARAGSAA